VIQKKLFKYFTYPMIQFFDLLGIDWIERQTREKINMENDLKAFQYQTKLSNLQAAVGLKQLKKLDEVHRLRRSNAQKLVDELSKVENIPAPVTVKNAEATYLYFRIQVKDPKLFKKLMLDRGVDTKLDDMSACSALADFSKYHVSCPIAERLPLESLGIPNSPYLNDEDILYIVEQIKYVSNEVYSKT
jgi:dTDP-4-amino-4,6-dideoxygalactose transaminase